MLKQASSSSRTEGVLIADDPSSCGGGGRILVVDDDPMLRMLAVETLSNAGFEVIEAEDGAAAVLVAQQLRPDVILLDVVMPKLDGYEACKRLRSRPATATTPIVMMTGRDDGGSIDQAFELGATDFVTKPINYKLLAHRLRYVLRAANAFAGERSHATRLARAQTLAKLAQWELDPSRGRFIWAPEASDIFGIPVSSSHKEETLETALLQWIHPDDRSRVAALMTTPNLDGAEYIDGANCRISSSSSHPPPPPPTRTIELDFRLVPPDGGERVVHQHAMFVVDPIDVHLSDRCRTSLPYEPRRSRRIILRTSTVSRNYRTGPS